MKTDNMNVKSVRNDMGIHVARLRAMLIYCAPNLFSANPVPALTVTVRNAAKRDFAED